MRNLFILFAFSILISGFSYSQVVNPVKWEFTSKIVNESTAELKFTAKIDKGWHMYGLNIPPDGPVPTSFSFENENNLAFLNKIIPVQKPEVKYDSTFEMTVELFSHRVDFTRSIKLVPGAKQVVKGSVTFMACDDSRCLPPKDESFEFVIEGFNASGQSETIKKENSTPSQINQEPSVKADTGSASIIVSPNDKGSISQTIQQPKKKWSLWEIILKALGGGFLAVLTPCVYPIIPLTVSFFMRSKNRRKAIADALLFGGSIIIIYTLIGLIAGLTRFDITLWIKTQQFPNILFFVVFIILAISFFGAFELVLPSKWTNSIDQQADKGGIMGPFFMALATVFVSFSCVGPIAGVILGDALRGEVITPVVGMFAFSLTFALPFTLLAIFPGFIKNLPKSGGWLNSIKVVFAFILLAFSMVFITNLQLSYVTRDVILVIEIVIFFMLGLYLLGKIKFAHDSDLSHISIPRFFLSFASFCFALYMIPGLFGAPLKTISPFLPPKEEMIFDLTRNNVPAMTLADVNSTCTEKPKYSELFTMPLGLKGYFDYDEALQCAKKLNKPVLIDFAGHSCKNCKKMYAEVWSDAEVLKLLNENFIIAVLYTDDNTMLAKEDIVVSKIDNKVKNTIGKKFNDLQIEKFNTNTLPLYAIVDTSGNIITKKPYHEYSPDIVSFIEFLKEGITSY